MSTTGVPQLEAGLALYFLKSGMVTHLRFIEPDDLLEAITDPTHVSQRGQSFTVTDELIRDNEWLELDADAQIARCGDQGRQFRPVR